jgi:DNA-binding transcriptional MerR regulator
LELLTVADVGKREGLTPEGVRYWVAQGVLRPEHRTAGGVSLYTDAAVAEFSREREKRLRARRGE